MATETAPNTDPPAADPAAAATSPPTDPPTDPPTEPAPAAAADGDPPADPPADPPDGDPEPSKKAVAAAKGHETRAKKAARRAELADDPDVQKLVEQAEARALTKAKESASEEAKRATMTEVDRMKAEAEDIQSELKEAKSALGLQKLEREYGDALIDSELKVLPNSRKLMRGLVADAMTADTSLTAADALTMVAADHDNLLQLASAAPGVSPAPQPKRSGASTTPTPKRETATPATQAPDKGVDVSGMSKKEFGDYRLKKYGINFPH